MPNSFHRPGVDFSKNFIRGAARLLIADMTKPFPTTIGDIIRTTTAGQTNEVQTVSITGTPTGGTFRLTFKGYQTAALNHNSTNAQVQAALEALSSIGTGGVTVTGGPGPATPWVATFANQNSFQAQPLLVPDSTGLTGGTTPTVGVVRTTAGGGQYDAQSGWIDCGATLGGVTVNRNNAEEAFSVDQVNADILRLPNAWEVNVSTAMALADIDTLQWVWELGTITLNGTTGERTIGIGTPATYRRRRLAVGFIRPDVTGTGNYGFMRFFCFRDTTRAAGDSQLVMNKTGDQAAPAFTWTCNADQTQQDDSIRFGTIIDQA